MSQLGKATAGLERMGLNQPSLERALRSASEGGELDVVKGLLQMGANVEAADSDGAR